MHHALKDQHCRPLRGEVNRLDGERCEAMLRSVEGWAIVDGELRKEHRFHDYHHTMAFVNAVAWIAHQQNHHPELEVHYNRCVVRYSTHDVGGLSLNDFICAARVDALGVG